MQPQPHFSPTPSHLSASSLRLEDTPEREDKLEEELEELDEDDRRREEFFKKMVKPKDPGKTEKEEATLNRREASQKKKLLLNEAKKAKRMTDQKQLTEFPVKKLVEKEGGGVKKGEGFDLEGEEPEEEEGEDLTLLEETSRIKKKRTLNEKFEPTEGLSPDLTPEDLKIIELDIPERLQGRAKAGETELWEEANWVGERIREKRMSGLVEGFVKKTFKALQLIRNSNYEVFNLYFS